MPAGPNPEHACEPEYALGLLDACGAADVPPWPRAAERSPSRSWAESGAMALTGHAAGAPRFATGALAHCASEALRAFVSLVEAGPARAALAAVDAPALLGERAAIAGTARRGATSPGGSARLLRTADDTLALNLARESDWRLVPAWLEVDVDVAAEIRVGVESEVGDGSGARVAQGSADVLDAGSAGWARIAAWLASRAAAPLVARGREIGLPVASLGEARRCAASRVAAHSGRGAAGPSDPERDPRADASAPGWMRAVRYAPPGPPRLRAPRVLDLSSLWAGPLCASLLGLAGADVVKVESRQRPDGARRGPAHFLDLMNAGKRSVALDWRDAGDLHTLRALIAAADIVIESARPRALAQLGIDAQRLIRDTPGLTWIGITGHGRDAPQCDWVAFGDDAAIAAGVTAEPGDEDPGPVFVGDAIADPLTGLHAAVAALAGHRGGGGRLFDVALARVTRHAQAQPLEAEARRVAPPDTRDGAWMAHIGATAGPVAAPRARPRPAPAAALGRDTHAVLCDWGVAP